MPYSPAELAIPATSMFLIALWIVFFWRSNLRVGPRLLPGPRGLPFLGNIFQVPGEHLATYFQHLVEEYGSLVSLNLAGSTVILIGDMKVAKALLEKHSAKHSSRPLLPYVRKYVDPQNSLGALSEECEGHSLGRKLTKVIMSLMQAGKTEPLQEYEAALNIQHLLNEGSNNWFHHIQRTTSSTILTSVFGMHSPTGREPELKSFLDLLSEWKHLATSTASIINIFPFLDLVPGPMPWRTRANSFLRRNDALYEKLVDDAVATKASGMHTWAAFFAEEDKPEGDQRQLVRQFASAAIETTTVSLLTFVLACIRYPDWIATAQKQIDDVVGTERLPTFKDRPFLPYVEAIVRENYRWRPAARFGVPHRSTADDVIEHDNVQYFIPKDSIIFAVTWAIEHDQSNFEDHDRFMPERFLDSDGKLKPNYETSAFGFGRRVCPGIPFAERSLWIVIATMLWTFNIRASDEIDQSTGLPFQYDDSDAAFNGDVHNSVFSKVLC